jgi:hypothetical protein
MQQSQQYATTVPTVSTPIAGQQPGRQQQQPMIGQQRQQTQQQQQQRQQQLPRQTTKTNQWKYDYDDSDDDSDDDISYNSSGKNRQYTGSASYCTRSQVGVHYYYIVYFEVLYIDRHSQQCCSHWCCIVHLLKPLALIDMV